MLHADLPPQEILNLPAQVREQPEIDLIGAPPRLKGGDALDDPRYFSAQADNSSDFVPAKEERARLGAKSSQGETSAISGADDASGSPASNSANVYNRLGIPKPRFDPNVPCKLSPEEQRNVLRQLSEAVRISCEVDFHLEEILRTKKPVVLLTDDIRQSCENITGIEKNKISKTVSGMEIRDKLDGSETILIDVKVTDPSEDKVSARLIATFVHELYSVDQPTGRSPKESGLDVTSKTINFLEELAVRRPDIRLRAVLSLEKGKRAKYL